MRKLSGKTINSLALCVALAAPLVYLFGSLFMSLAGAHGEIMFKEEPFEAGERYEEVQSITNTGQYMFQWNESFRITTNTTFRFNFTSNNVEYEQINMYSSQEIYYTGQNPTAFVRDSSSEWRNPTLKTIYATIDNINTFPQGILGYAKGYILTPYDQKTDYSNYLFGQFFTENNWLTQSGKEVLNGTPLYGFEPIGELVRYTDENMLHLANLSYGPLVIGYTYYCAHVIIVDLIFYIGSFIPRLIKKTINKLEGGLD